MEDIKDIELRRFPGLSIVLVLIGVIVALTYIYKGYKYRGIHDITGLLWSLSCMNIWGIVMAMLGDQLVAYLGGVRKFLRATDKSVEQVSLTNPADDTALNHMYLRKDVVAIIVIAVSAVLIHRFGCAMLRCVEYILFVNNSKDEEAKPVVRTHKKSVLFDESLVTYSIEKMNTTCMATKLPEESFMQDMCCNRYVRRFFAVFVVTFSASLVCMPRSFQLSTSSVWVRNEWVNLTADNVIVPLVVAFIADCISKLFNSLSSDNLHHYCSYFPRSTQIICKFIYFYVCFLVVCMFVAVRVFGDVFLNCAQGDIGIDAPFWTVVFGSYVSHAIRVEHMVAVYDNVVGCLNVLNGFAFTVLPLLVWFCVECKIGGVKRSRV